MRQMDQGLSEQPEKLAHLDRYKTMHYSTHESALRNTADLLALAEKIRSEGSIYRSFSPEQLATKTVSASSTEPGEDQGNVTIMAFPPHPWVEKVYRR